jgi:hypothetical protein
MITLTNYLTKHSNTINGKALRKPDLNLIAKLDKMRAGIEELPEGDLAFTRNPVSGYSGLLDPFISYLIRWTFTVGSTYDPEGFGGMTFGKDKVAIGTYDRVRMLVLSLDNAAYSNFLD